MAALVATLWLVVSGADAQQQQQPSSIPADRLARFHALIGARSVPGPRPVRWLGYLHDPQAFEVPIDVWLSPDHHRAIAEVLRRRRPNVDLTEHIRLTSGTAEQVASGLLAPPPLERAPGISSCELSIVDPQGNWVQMMNTLQRGGIPGVVVDGVPMHGSNAVTDMSELLAGWFAGHARIREVIGNTIVLKDGRPWLSLGTPGPWNTPSLRS